MWNSFFVSTFLVSSFILQYSTVDQSTRWISCEWIAFPCGLLCNLIGASKICAALVNRKYTGVLPGPFSIFIRGLGSSQTHQLNIGSRKKLPSVKWSAASCNTSRTGIYLKSHCHWSHILVCESWVRYCCLVLCCHLKFVQELPHSLPIVTLVRIQLEICKEIIFDCQYWTREPFALKTSCSLA